MKYPLKTITLLIALLTGLSPLTACASADTDIVPPQSLPEMMPMTCSPPMVVLLLISPFRD